MIYGFTPVIGVFVGSAWDITHNNGYWITVIGRAFLHGLKTFGIL